MLHVERPEDCPENNKMGKRGETLKKGELITTGVVVDKLVVVNVGDTVNVNYGDLLGTVTFSFEK